MLVAHKQNFGKHIVNKPDTTAQKPIAIIEEICLIFLEVWCHKRREPCGRVDFDVIVKQWSKV